MAQESDLAAVVSNAAQDIGGFIRTQRKRCKTHHHAFIGFRRVPGERQRIVGVMVAVHVGNLNFRLENRCLEGHEVVNSR